MNRKISKSIGLFYIIATLAGVAGAMINGIRMDVHVNQDSVKVLLSNEALAILVMAVSVSMIAVLFMLKLREFSETFAYGYLLLRFLEGIMFLGMAVAVLMQRATWQDSGNMMMEGFLIASIGWMNIISSILFAFSALILYYMLTKHRLLPRFITLWGLIATIPYMLNGFMGLYGVQVEIEMFEVIMLAPLALNEMVMALYLIIKGFKEYR